MCRNQILNVVRILYSRDKTFSLFRKVHTCHRPLGLPPGLGVGQ